MQLHASVFCLYMSTIWKLTLFVKYLPSHKPLQGDRVCPTIISHQIMLPILNSIPILSN